MNAEQIRKLASFCDGRTITADAKTGELLRACADVVEAAKRVDFLAKSVDMAKFLTDARTLSDALAKLEAIEP